MQAPVHSGQGLVGLAISPDGRSLLSQADSGDVCVTAMEAMRTMLTLQGLGPVAWPSAPAFSLDGASVLARGTDSICCWDASSGDLICKHRSEDTLGVCWALPQAVSVHSNGYAALWGAEDEPSA